jgi:ATP-binding cassette subfamily F protein 3
MLILDEPTNHLDIDSRDALIAALNDYEGAVLIISHDRHLIDATVDKLWIAQNGTIEEFDADLDTYQRMLTGGTPKDEKKKGSAANSQDDRKQQRQDAAARRAEIAPLRKQIKDAETKIGRLRTELARVDAVLADPKTYDGAPERVVLLGKDKARYEGEIAKVEEKWLEMSTQLEDAEKAIA